MLENCLRRLRWCYIQFAEAGSWLERKVYNSTGWWGRTNKGYISVVTILMRRGVSSCAVGVNRAVK
jgi:hypothetical protein